MKENRLKVTAQGSKPLQFQWFKDEEPLSDSARYKGSNTAELVIEGIDSELKGTYTCRVTDRKENMKEGKIEFGTLNVSLHGYNWYNGN